MLRKRKSTEITNNNIDDKSMRNDSNNSITDEIGKVLCFFCFDYLSHKLNKSKLTVQVPIRGSYPLFVSWHEASNKSLRGCIGTFSSHEILYNLKEYTIKSAFEDTRFNPIKKEELPKLECSVSILFDFEDHFKYNQWTVGIHGIRIEFKNENGSRRSATFLPHVAKERDWDHVATIKALLRKGGYKSSPTISFMETIDLTRFKSKEVTATYQEYEIHTTQN